MYNSIERGQPWRTPHTRLDFGERNFNHANELDSKYKAFAKRKDKITIKSIKGIYSVCLTHRLYHE